MKNIITNLGIDAIGYDTRTDSVTAVSVKYLTHETTEDVLRTLNHDGTLFTNNVESLTIRETRTTRITRPRP